MMAAGDVSAASAAHSPDLSGATAWINSPPLTLASLRGKVVLMDFWTYSCINCLRTLPYIKAWNEKYKDSGLVIIGVHTPEFPFEKDESNVRKAVRIWASPIRFRWITTTRSGGASTMNTGPRLLYRCQGQRPVSPLWRGRLRRVGTVDPHPAHRSKPRCDSGDLTKVAGSGTEAAPDHDDVQSPETYIGYRERRTSPRPADSIRMIRKVYEVSGRAETEPVGAQRQLEGRGPGRYLVAAVQVSLSASMHAIFIWSWGHPRMEKQSASG